ncbi:cytochrome P450 [Amanita rubescens]|nr:cytochrome P450 [Amanita rubescens]
MLTSLLCLLFGLVVIFVLVSRKKSRLPYPPGPPPKPFIGNALDIPTDMPWVKYLEWSKRLNSDIIHMTALGKHIVVLNKLEDINELMEKRSAIYSNRPWIPATEMLGVDNITGLIPYGSEWRKHRNILHEGLRKEQLPHYEGTHTNQIRLMIDQLLDNPTEFRDHCKWLSVAVTMSTTFGYDIPAGDIHHKYITSAEEILGAVSVLCHPSGTIINAIPFLRHIPTWLPGAFTQRYAANAKQVAMAYKTEPFEWVKSRFLAGTAKDCVLARLLSRRLKHDGLTFEDEVSLRDTMAQVYLASIETIQATQLVFLMAMALYPAVQKRAQDEIDRVVGRERLPSYEDRASLPIVEALVREALRWRPVGPLAIPHTAAKDDIYKGYYIPKGTLVMGNAWAVSQDESLYTNANSFCPERFLNPDGTLTDDKVEHAFGYGRRFCPGKYMARDVMWLMVASVLSVFNVSKAKDENGVEIDIDPDAFNSGLSSPPKPFKCAIAPRSPQAARLVRAGAVTAKKRQA